MTGWKYFIVIWRMNGRMEGMRTEESDNIYSLFVFLEFTFFKKLYTSIVLLINFIFRYFVRYPRHHQWKSTIFLICFIALRTFLCGYMFAWSPRLAREWKIIFCTKNLLEIQSNIHSYNFLKEKLCINWYTFLVSRPYFYAKYCKQIQY